MNDQFPKVPGKYQATIKFPAPLLDEGVYEFDISLQNDVFYFDEKQEIQFEILDQGSFVTYVRKEPRGEIICIPLEWEVKKISDS